MRRETCHGGRLLSPVVALLCCLLSHRGCAVEIVQTLPGIDARGAAWNSSGPWVLGEAELRRLRLDDGPGGLLLQERLVLPGAAREIVLGERLALVRDAEDGLLAVNLEEGATAPALAGISALVQDGHTVLAAGASGVWQGRLDQATPGFTQVLGAFSAAPTALCGRDGLAWLVAADTLRGFVLGDPPVPLGRARIAGVLRMAEHEDRLLACRGGEGLTVLDLADPFVPVPWPWQPGFPVLDALWWRDRIFVMAAGDSGLVLVDTADPGTPQMLGRWRTAHRAERLALLGDSLLVAEGALGLSLHVLRLDGADARVDPLARHATRPRLLSIPHVDQDAPVFWCLDADQGFRRVEWTTWPQPEELRELAGVPLPLPVDGGDISGDPWGGEALLFAGCRYGAGLRFYEETDEGIVLRGIHPTDPVKLMAWGPDDLVAYVTPGAFVAIKQARRSPWIVLHHGTINLQAEPLSVAWSGHRLLVGCADGRLFCIDAADPAAPALESVHDLAGPVRCLSASVWGGVMAAADRLYLLNQPGGGAFQLADSLTADGSFVACSFTGYAVAATRAPNRVMEITEDGDGHLTAWGAVDLDAEPLAVTRCISDGSCHQAMLGLENGDLHLLWVVSEIGVDPGPVKPEALVLRAWPNPFNPATRLSFTLASPVMSARVTVHDLAGRSVMTRELGPLPAGSNDLELVADGWPSGLYLVGLEAGPCTATVKLLLLH